MCRSRREVSNEYLVAIIGFDTEENEPCKVCPLSVYCSAGTGILLFPSAGRFLRFGCLACGARAWGLSSTFFGLLGPDAACGAFGGSLGGPPSGRVLDFFLVRHVSSSSVLPTGCLCCIFRFQAVICAHGHVVLRYRSLRSLFFGYFWCTSSCWAAWLGWFPHFRSHFRVPSLCGVRSDVNRCAQQVSASLEAFSGVAFFQVRLRPDDDDNDDDDYYCGSSKFT